jgi:hypothetical protein
LKTCERKWDFEIYRPKQRRIIGSNAKRVPMKNIFLCSLACFIAFSFVYAKNTSEKGDCIKSIVGIKFGEIFTVQGEFIDKPNTYYAQNISKSTYWLKIVEINGKKLDGPMIVEPDTRGFKPQRHLIYKLKAFESLQTVNQPKDWDDQVPLADNSIVHIFVVKI